MNCELSAPRANLRSISSSVLAGTLLLALAWIRIKRLRKRCNGLLDASVTAPNDRWLWHGTAVLVLTLHVVGIALAIQAAKPDEIADLGVAALEVRLELTTPLRETTDFPSKPQDDNMVAVEKVVNDPAKWLQAEPIEIQNPDLTVSQNATHTLHEDENKAKAIEKTLSRKDIASEAELAPSVVTKETGHSAVPVLGSGNSSQHIRLTWEKRLLAHLARHKSYPTGAARPTGEVILTFVLDRTGHVLSAIVLKDSGDRAMDQAALAMMQRSDPVPPPPPPVADAGLSFTIPVLFHAKQLKR